MKFKLYEKIATDEIKNFETRWLNKLKSYGLTDFEFSNHTGKLRLNDPRNSPSIEVEELDLVLNGFLKKYGSELRSDIEKVKNNTAKRRGKNKNDIPPNNLEFTVKSNSTNINFTFVLKQNFKKKGTAVIVPITIMRKKGWKTIKGEEIIVERKEIFDMDLVDKYLSELSTPDKHQLKILKDTIKNPMKGKFLGGPSAEEAEKILKTKFGYSDEQIKKLKK